MHVVSLTWLFGIDAIGGRCSSLSWLPPSINAAVAVAVAVAAAATYPPVADNDSTAGDIPLPDKIGEE